MAQMYEIPTVLSSISSGTAYVAPTDLTNDFYSISFQAKGAAATLHEDATYASSTQYTIQENQSLTINTRYMAGKTFYLKSAGTVEILILPGIGT